jgi:viroplasmin and RNaseH domain-containing protein
VARGRQLGIYYNWHECKLQVDRFRGARYKSFLTRREADEFLRLDGIY